MKLLDDYFKLEEEIHNYFGYVEDWVAIPMDDATMYTWHLNPDSVSFWLNDEELEKNEWYTNQIYTQRFLKKWVYVGKAYTMVVVDTQVDGNKFLQIFSNKLEVQELPEKILDFSF